MTVSPIDQNVYITESAGNFYRKIDLGSGIVSILAGSLGRRRLQSSDSMALTATLDTPTDSFIDTNGRIYLADTGNYEIRILTANIPSPAPSQVPTEIPSEIPTEMPSVALINVYLVAGTGEYASGGSEGQASSAQLKLPIGIWEDSSGVIYIAESDGYCVRKLSVSDYIIHAFAGVCGSNSDVAVEGTQATATLFQNPCGIAGGLDGTVYIADSGSNYIRTVDTSGIVATFAGDGSASDDTTLESNVKATATNFANIFSVWLSSSGVLYASSQGGLFVVRTIDTNGIVVTVAGNGESAFNGDEGQATSSSLSDVYRLAGDTSGNVYFTDIGKLIGSLLRYSYAVYCRCRQSS